MVGALITKNASHSIFSREERERKGERQGVGRGKGRKKKGDREGERQEEVGEGGRRGRGKRGSA